MNITGTHAEIMEQFGIPEVVKALEKARQAIPQGKQEVYAYQGAALFALAKPYNRKGAHILEIGTYYGYSTAMIKQAAPKAEIITLNPRKLEAQTARQNLASFEAISVVEQLSWDYLENYAGPQLDMIFVDGDHKRVTRDIPWWNEIAVDGLFIFHDYTPLGNKRHCPPVYEMVNEFADWLGRAPDVLIIDDDNVGMAGFYKRGNDPKWPMQP